MAPMPKPLALLACLLVLAQHVPLPSQARTLAASAREKQQLAQQLATQKAWQALELAKLRRQQQAQAAKLQAMKDDQQVTEAEQFAAMTRAAARKAKRDKAAAVEQQQLQQKAVQARLAAARLKAARQGGKAARQGGKAARAARRRSEWYAAVAAAAAQSQDAPVGGGGGGGGGGNNGGGGGGGGNNNGGGGGGGQSYRGPTGPIWGMTTGTAPRGGPGPVYATYHYYAPGYETSSLYCADAFAPHLPAKPDTFLLQYPWTAYCNDAGLGPMSQDKCGRCLKVTNPRTGQWVKTRVVDMCGNKGVDLDPLAFNAIDADGAGVRDGHMNLLLEWC